MILIWLVVWALAGTPGVGGWWLVTLIIAAIASVTPGTATQIDVGRKR